MPRPWGLESGNEIDLSNWEGTDLVGLIYQQLVSFQTISGMSLQPANSSFHLLGFTLHYGIPSCLLVSNKPLGDLPSSFAMQMKFHKEWNYKFCFHVSKSNLTKPYSVQGQYSTF